MQDMTADEIEAMLNEAMIGRLSMADRNGRPYTIPFPFCWADGALYLRLLLSGRKGAVLAQNDQVCFEVDHFTQNLDEYASVLIEGRLVSVSSIAEKERAMRKIVIDQISGRRRDSISPTSRVYAPLGRGTFVL